MPATPRMHQALTPAFYMNYIPFNLSAVPWGRYFAFLLFQIRRWDTPRSGDLSRVIQQVSNGAGNPTHAHPLPVPVTCLLHSLLWTKFTSQRLSILRTLPPTSNPMCHLSDTSWPHKPLSFPLPASAFPCPVTVKQAQSGIFSLPAWIKLLSLWRWLFTHWHHHTNAY